MIIHVDMDAFYASVEQRDNPSLRGRPVVVGGSATGRGVVAAASYEARKYGIHSAMSGKRAVQLCPDAVFVKSNIKLYAEVGHQVREIFHRFTPIVQPLSLDEAFLDVSGCLKLFGSAVRIGEQIRGAIEDELQLPASVGIAPVKFVAKIASDFEKPRGFVVVRPEEVLDFLGPLPVERLWGVGAVGLKKLQLNGLYKIRDIRKLGPESCRQLFGTWGEHLYQLSIGADPRAVVPDHQCKSIGHERTFPEDVTDDRYLEAALTFLVEQVAMRLRGVDRSAGVVTLKYRLHDFKTITRNATLRMRTDSTKEFLDVVLALLHRARIDFPRSVRLVGVSLGGLSETAAPKQMELFDREQAVQQAAVDTISDQLKQKFGETVIYRATAHSWIDRK